jgi:predicted RNA-binding Zn ribbon-like protein
MAFQLIGARPALDFVNTVGGRRESVASEHLHRFSDLVAWAAQAELLTQAEARALSREALAHPAEAEGALLRARAYREALYRVMRSLLEPRPPGAADMEALEVEFQRALAGRRLEVVAGRLRWTAPDVPLLDVVLSRVALASMELLASESFERVRQCEATSANGCGWLFLDETRNHSRRWCEMATCGNQHKARRHYARVRAKR